ncbi:MAG TPA: AraC family transcriptional regulator [Lachnospiraceae bacterium]|nr:AraC family transcriptional regulator [Lachnospiraceae bacterium]
MEPFTTYEKHNYYSLAFSDYRGTSFDNGDAIGFRLTLLLIEDGSGIASINGHAVPYIAPCVFCLHETEHCVIPESDKSKMKALFFHPSVINSYLNYENIRNDEWEALTVSQDKYMFKFFVNRDDNFKGKFNLGPLSAKKVNMLLDEIHDLISKQPGDGWPCRSRAYMMQLLFFLDNMYEAGLFENETSIEVLQQEFYPILIYVYHNYDKKISVADITNEFHISRTTFAQMFQKNVGDSFLSYLNKLRITIAATMLRDTLLPVNEIMFRVGFTDQVHFLRTFKKITKMTPSTYREEYNWM